MMKKILIANPKGGSGKTTLSTNLAGYFASQKREVYLLDLDKQQSAASWLKRRPKKLPKIHKLSNLNAVSKNKSADFVVIDSPAGLRGEKLRDLIKEADWVVVPMQASIYDRGATHDFIEKLKEEKAVRKERTFVAMLGMRINSRTKATEHLEAFLSDSGFPSIGILRDTQIYAHSAEEGLSIFDMPLYRVKKDIKQWIPLLAWLKVQGKKGKKKAAFKTLL